MSYPLCTDMLFHSPKQRLQNVPFTYEHKKLNSCTFSVYYIYCQVIRPTFYPGFLFICKMLCPCPDYQIYIVYAENLRKPPEP